MDIEGSEGPLLDNWFIPQCKKLVMEYHFSRDRSVPNFKHRLSLIKNHFHSIHYTSEIDSTMAVNSERFEITITDKSGKQRTVARPPYDRLIFAWDPK